MDVSALFNIDPQQFTWFISPNFLSLRTLLLALACYVYGSVPFGLIFTYLFKKEVLSRSGSLNIGVANAFGVGGLKVGFATVAGEISKAMLPLALAHYLYGSELAAALVFALVAILGANFSVFLKGKGGRATTILLWTLLILSPYSFLIYITLFIIIFFSTRKPFVTAMVGNALLPFEIYLIEINIPFAIFGALAALIYCVRYDRRRSDTTFYSLAGRFRIPKLKKDCLVKLVKAKKSTVAGLKASHLSFLRKAGFRVPRTWICTFEAYEDYNRNRAETVAALRRELGDKLKPGKKYCVRSSTNLEDEREYSFAGQFESYLHLTSHEAVAEAVVQTWESSRGKRVAAYLKHIGKSTRDIKMGVIIQEMVASRRAGVVFTKNPINSMDEVIVELVYGSGELVQVGVTPERWVYKWGNWREKPGGQKRVPKLISQLVEQAKAIARKYGKPVDLEWAYEGREIYWLQLREITTLKGVNVYSNKISKEFMPGIIKPLVWSVNIPVVNSSWKRLLIEMVGRAAIDIDIDSLAKQFYYRSYFNMGIIGDIFELLGMSRESIEIIMGFEVPGGDTPRLRPTVKTIRYLPRIMLFAISKLMSAGRLGKFLRAQPTRIERYETAAISSMGIRQTFKQIEQLMRISTEASYYVIISQLLMGFHTVLLRRLLSRQRVDIHSLDLTEEREQLQEIDINHHLSQLHEEYEALSKAARSKIAIISYEELAELPDLAGFSKSVEKFIALFGHLGESGNDFSRRTYRESSELLLKMISSYSSGKVGKGKKWNIDEIARGYWQRPLLKFAYKQMLKFRVYREKVSFLYTRGYSLFRPYFTHLAALFKARGFIKEEGDIFYLTLAEVKSIASSGRMKLEYKENLRRRKWEIARYKNFSLPALIVGDTAPAHYTSAEVTSKLKGVAAAKGYREGRVKVVSGLEEFGKVTDGDIIVIPHSDVSWTPLFTKAKAVISESGGMLSHCAIVAREYNIPAVVSVTGAMKLKDGTRVRVDGYVGEVTLL